MITESPQSGLPEKISCDVTGRYTIWGFGSGQRFIVVKELFQKYTLIT
jgi:hypothetical protein